MRADSAVILSTHFMHDSKLALTLTLSPRERGPFALLRNLDHLAAGDRGHRLPHGKTDAIDDKMHRPVTPHILANFPSPMPLSQQPCLS